jgi:hypothetical protein
MVLSCPAVMTPPFSSTTKIIMGRPSNMFYRIISTENDILHLYINEQPMIDRRRLTVLCPSSNIKKKYTLCIFIYPLYIFLFYF